ncbi:MAG: B12-binding domain-containing radical SAM protein, partial [Deltaproteobacteria bacterium]|nr:B12-binding domain-containing radical SAM protein [Deltaproteobacteria bacterium]
MKVLLIHPRLIDSINKESETVIENVGFVPPLGIAYIASSLEKNGHQVSILDCEALELSTAEIKQHIESLKPEVVGVSSLTTNVRGALESAKLAKQTGSLVILGGPHLMVFPQETLAYEFIDYGIRGEGEIAMVQLLRCISKGGPLEKVPGVVFRMNEQVVANEPARVDDIDAVPMPAYHLLPLDKYEISNFGGKTLSMFTTRGCPYNCGFCYRNPLLDKVRKRDPIKVVDEIEYLIKRFKVNHINFVDEVITFDKKHMRAICEEILQRKLKVRWQAATRVNTVDGELLKLMHHAGCHTLRFGV